MATPPRSASAPAASSSRKGKSLLIRDFTVVGGKVGLSMTAFGGQGLSAALPDVHLTDIGGTGSSPSEAAAQAFRAIASSAQGAVSNLGGKSLDAALGAASSVLGAFLKRGGK